MGQKINFKRAILLFKSIIIINKKIITSFTALIIGVISIAVCLDIALSWHKPMEYKIIEEVIKYVYMAMLIFTPPILYSQYREKKTINISQLVPASINEKFFVPFFISIVVIPLLVISLLIVLLSIFFALYILMNGNEMVNIGVIDSTTQYSNITVYIATLKQTVFSKGNIIALVVFTALQSCSFSSCTWEKKYQWIPIALFTSLMVGTVIIQLTFGCLTKNMVLYMALIQVLFFWILAYYKFKKVQINK